MTEKVEERDAIKRKNAKRIAIGIIAAVLWITIFAVLINQSYEIWGKIEFVLGGVALILLITKLNFRVQDDNRIMREAEDMEKAKQILSGNAYTPVECSIDMYDIQRGYLRIEAIKSLTSTQAELLKRFNYTLAAKLSEDKVLYAIVDENGNEISAVDMYDTATFFVNNFKKI